MKFRILLSFIMVLGFLPLMGQTYQKLSTLERSSAPGMFPLTKTVSGQNIMVYAVFDTAVNGVIDTNFFVTIFHLDSALNAVEGRMTWLKPQLEDSAAVVINANYSFSLDSLPLLNFQAKRTGGSSKSQLIMSSQTALPAQFINQNAAGDSATQAKISLDFDGTSFFEAVILEMRARGGTAKINLRDTVATVYGTLFLNKYQSPFNYLGSPPALLGVNGLGEVWAVDPDALGRNGIYGGSGEVPDQTIATFLGTGSDAFGFWFPDDYAINFNSSTGGKQIDIKAGANRIHIDEAGNVNEYTAPLNLFQNSDDTKSGFIAIEEPSGEDYIQIQSPALAATWGLTLPPNNGDAGQFLQTDGNGVTTWAATGSGSANLTWSGTDPNFTLSAGGTTAGVVAGNGIEGSTASNILTLDGLRSGTVTNGTSWTLAGTLAISTVGGLGVYPNQSGSQIVGSLAGNQLNINPSTNVFAFGNTAGATGTAALRLYNNDGDFVAVTIPATIDASYTLSLPGNGDGAPAGSVITSTGGGVTTFKMPPVYMSWTHTSFQEVSITEEALNAIVIPQELAGYTITSASYRMESNVGGTGDLGVELTRISTGGTITDNFLTGSIVNGTNYIRSTMATMLVSEGDLISCLPTIGTTTGEGLTITIKLEKI